MKEQLKKGKEKTKGTMKEFKEFAFKGNIVDMAVGVIIGGAFGKIVTSFTNDLIMPCISFLTKGINFDALFIALDKTQEFPTAQAAIDAGVPVINFGSFITVIVDFLITAICIFFAIKAIAKFKKEEKAEEPKTKKCPYCKSEIAKDATKCPHCTSKLD